MTSHRTKGTGVASFLAELKERFPAERLAALRATLPPNAQALMSRSVLPIEWLPLDDVCPIQEAVLADLLNGDEQRFMAISSAASMRDMNGIYRVLLRVLSPETVLKQGARIFRTYQERGTLSVHARQKIGNREQVTVVLEDYHPADIAALAMTGYMAGVLAASGAKNIEVLLKTKQVRGDAARLEYEASWG